MKYFDSAVDLQTTLQSQHPMENNRTGNSAPYIVFQFQTFHSRFQIHVVYPGKAEYIRKR